MGRRGTLSEWFASAEAMALQDIPAVAYVGLAVVSGNCRSIHGMQAYVWQFENSSKILLTPLECDEEMQLCFFQPSLNIKEANSFKVV